ncbi:WD40 repeat domain-containing protein, partial [Candidatus Albibeggiatoa sp. nov. NOAA]|uniref:WD40 repeat domain-containing protein n=1 Tax=Candidatus Albibeggiatoa sp. nov. NOAA TaxID=3162724 RepID=UPI0032F6011D|nr:hypothetical protein [Thiotrichaceae bacterium]
TNQCDYELNLEQGTYVSKITLDENGQAGVWGISILPPAESNLKIDTQGIGFGTSLQADGASPNWISFSITEPKPLSLTLFNYTDATQSIQANIQQLQQDEYVSIGQLSLHSEQLTSTEPLAAGKYIISLQNTNAAYVGLLIQGNGLIYHSAGGWIEPNSDQVGFLYFNVLDVGEATLSNYFADMYDDLGASKPLLDFDYIANTQAPIQPTPINMQHDTLVTGLSATVMNLTMSPDGSLLAAGFEDGSLTIWDMSTQEIYASTQVFANENQTAVKVLQFSPDGRILVTGSSDDGISMNIKIWDVTNLQTLATFENIFFSIAFSPDSSLMAFHRGDKTIIWNTQTQNISLEINTLDQSILVDSSFYQQYDATFEFSANNQLLTGFFYTSDESTTGVYIWDLNTGTQIKKLDVKASAVAISPDNSTLIASVNAVDGYSSPNQDNVLIYTEAQPTQLQFWEMNSFSLIDSIEAKQKTIEYLRFNPDSTNFISQSKDGQTILWDMASRTAIELSTFPNWLATTNDLELYINSQFIVKLNYPFEVTPLQLKNRLQQQTDINLLQEEQLATAMTFSPDGTQLIASMDDNSIRIWHTKQLAAVKQSFMDVLSGFGSVKSFESNQVKQFNNGFVTAFSPNTQTHTALFDDKWFEVMDQRLVTYFSNDGQLPNSRPSPYTSINRFIPSTNSLSAFDISEDKSLLVASENNVIKLFDMVTQAEIAQLQGLSETVNYLHLSQDKTRLAVFSSRNPNVNSTLSFWNLTTLTKLSETALNAHYAFDYGSYLTEKNVQHIQFSPDNQIFIGTDHLGDVVIAEVETGKRLLHLNTTYSFPPRTGIANAVFSPDGQQLFVLYRQNSSASNVTYMGHYQNNEYVVDTFPVNMLGDQPLFTGTDGTTFLISGIVVDNNSFTTFWDIATQTEHTEKRINGYYIYHDGKTMATYEFRVPETPYDDILYIWDMETQTQIAQINGSYLKNLENQENWIAYSTYNQTGGIPRCIATHIYDLTTREEIIQMDDTCGSITLDNSKTALISSTSDTVTVWDTTKKQQVFQYTDAQSGVSLSSDGQVLFHTVNNQLRLLDFDTIEPLPEFAQPNTEAAQIAPNSDTIAHTQQPWLAILNSDLSIEGVNTWDGIKLWNTETGKAFGYKNPSKLYSVAWHPQQAILAYADYAGQIHLWDVEADTETTLNHAFPAYFLAWSPDATMIAASGDNHIVYVWDTVTGIERAKLVHDAPVRSLAWSLDGKVFVSSAGSDIYLWDAVTGSQITRIFADTVTDIAFSADSNIIVSTGTGNDIRFWHVPTGSQISSLPDQAITAIATHPTQNILAYGTGDGYVKLYDFGQNQYVGSLKQYTYPVINIAFGHDGDTLIVDARETAIPSVATIKKQFVHTWSLSEIIQ